MSDKPPFAPIVLSIAAGTLWAVFMLLYVLFWSSGYDWLQNLAVIGLSLVVMCGIIGLMWVYWIYKRA